MGKRVFVNSSSSGLFYKWENWGPPTIMRRDFPRWQSWHKHQAAVPVPGSIYITLHHLHWPYMESIGFFPQNQIKVGFLFVFAVAWKIISGEEKQGNTYPFPLPSPPYFSQFRDLQTQPHAHTHTPTHTLTNTVIFPDRLYLLVSVRNRWLKPCWEEHPLGFPSLYFLSHHSKETLSLIYVIRYINLRGHSLWALGLEVASFYSSNSLCIKTINEW